MYRNRVEICPMFTLLFVFSSFTAAVHRLGSGILPHAHSCVFDVFLLFLCPSSVSLWCEHCRWILQSDYIVQDGLICLEKEKLINILIYNFIVFNILILICSSDHMRESERLPGQVYCCISSLFHFPLHLR